MASIQERVAPDGKKSFRAQVRVKGFPPQTATFDRKNDAKRWGEETESAICSRRLNIDPPRRLKFDPGLGAAF